MRMTLSRVDATVDGGPGPPWQLALLFS